MKQFALHRGFTTITLGTKKDSDACRFYDSLCPTTKVSDGEVNKYTWTLAMQPGATHIIKNRELPTCHWKPRCFRAGTTRWKPRDVLKGAASDLEDLARTGNADIAMACVVTPKQVAFWSHQDKPRHSNPNQVVFGIASFSKVLINLALELCYKKGILCWNDPISKYLSLDPDTELGQKRISQLAFHNGVPFMDDAALAPDGSPILSLEALLLVVQNYYRESRGIQASFEYSNINYTLLEMIITEATGKSSSVFLKEHILEPLQMKSTCVTKEDLDQIPQDRRGPYREYLNDVCRSPMGFCSTLEDLAKLFKAMLAPKQSKWGSCRTKTRPLDVDIFAIVKSHKGIKYSLFGTEFPPNTNVEWMSRNSLFSPAAEHDPTNFYPESLQCRTGAISGFDLTGFFLPDRQTVILVGASTQNYVDVAYPIGLRILQQLLPAPISPDVAQITSDIPRYQEITRSYDFEQASLLPLSGSFVCNELNQRFDFDETLYQATLSGTLSGRTVLKYQWKSAHAIILLPAKSPLALEWIKAWGNLILEITWEAGIVTGFVRMGWNGIMWKHKRLDPRRRVVEGGGRGGDGDCIP